MRTVAIIQARMGSTRLPGKVMMDLAGKPMLARELDTLKEWQRLDEIVLATTKAAVDDVLVQCAEAAGVRWFRGSEKDVLGRYVGAASESRADIVVRITADCPLLDPEVSDRVVAGLLSGPFDYASNTLRRTYPRGLDTEALHSDVLSRLGRMATSAAAREHVTWFLHQERPGLFVTCSVEDAHDNANLRWTVDSAADLDFVRRLYSRLGLARRNLPYPEVLDHLRQHPDESRTEDDYRRETQGE